MHRAWIINVAKSQKVIKSGKQNFGTKRRGEIVTPEQLKYMIGLAEIVDGKPTAAKVARRFGVNRSTVSRIFARCVEEGLLTEEFQFTFRGKNFIEGCLEKKKRLMHYMIWKGVPYEDARKDALEILCVCGQSTLDYLMQPEHSREKSRKRKLLEEKQITFSGYQ